MTHWHDASAVYGSTQIQSDVLRERKGGRLKTFSYQNRQLLPLDWNNKDCIGYNKGLRCFLSGSFLKTSFRKPSVDFYFFLSTFSLGDSRVNQLIGLTAMQTIWHREHNRVADELARVNPRWDDERTFQEARRVVIAELQHITYNEYLPILLGKSVAFFFTPSLFRLFSSSFLLTRPSNYGSVWLTSQDFWFLHRL